MSTESDSLGATEAQQMGRRSYWEDDISQLTIVDLGIEFDRIEDKELGGLISRFKHHYPTMSLVPLYFCANTKQHKIRFAVTHALTEWKPGLEHLHARDRALAAREELYRSLSVDNVFGQMRQFLEGYLDSIKVRRKGHKKYER